MLADVKRVPAEEQGSDPPYERGQLVISEGWIQWTGPKFGFRANGNVQTLSTPYPGADYHFSVQVLVRRNGRSERQLYAVERWFVKILEAGP